MATIANRRMRLNKALDDYNRRAKLIDEHIGRLMSKRVDLEEWQAEIMGKLQELDELERNLPSG